MAFHLSAMPLRICGAPGAARQTPDTKGLVPVKTPSSPVKGLLLRTQRPLAAP